MKIESKRDTSKKSAESNLLFSKFWQIDSLMSSLGISFGIDLHGFSDSHSMQRDGPATAPASSPKLSISTVCGFCSAPF